MLSPSMRTPKANMMLEDLMTVTFSLPVDQVDDLTRYAEAVGLNPSKALERFLDLVELGQWAYYAAGAR